MTDAQAALDRLCDPLAEVSAHYLIGRDGTLWQLVDEAMRAWHAGAGEWAGAGDVNSRSVGIELDNTGAQPFAEPLMAALESAIARGQHRIRRVLRHRRHAFVVHQVEMHAARSISLEALDLSCRRVEEWCQIRC